MAREAPWPIRWLFTMRYMKAVICDHYLHHRYLDCNYNLVLGGDYLLGRHRTATEADLQHMRRLGLAVD